MNTSGHLLAGPSADSSIKRTIRRSLSTLGERTKLDLQIQHHLLEMDHSNTSNHRHKRFKFGPEVPGSNLHYERYPHVRKKSASPWPRRLLHVSSMTSLEREAGNIYGEHKEPAYHAISYTWGRYADPSGSFIQVNNLSWAVPSIKTTHFSTEDFAAAIKLAGIGVDFVWVDIACIDQQDPVVKTDEIGKQAAIFRRASKVFAWLAPWDSEDLERSLLALEAFCTSSRELRNRFSLALLMKSSLARTDFTVVSLLKAIQGLVQQPWFTSLWTLQEAYLCKNAILLSRSSTIFSLGTVIDDKVEIPLNLNWLLVRCQQVFSVCMSMEDTSAHAVCQHLVDSGLLSLGGKNESTLYAASTKRQASLQNDRIYGIMQIYDISIRLTSELSALLSYRD